MNKDWTPPLTAFQLANHWPVTYDSTPINLRKYLFCVQNVTISQSKHLKESIKFINICQWKLGLDIAEYLKDSIWMYNVRFSVLNI